MKAIVKFVKNIIKDELPSPLGRWNITYCNKQLKRKIDLSNEDHCGVCKEYITMKQRQINAIPKPIK